MAYETILLGSYPANASAILGATLTELDGVTPVPGSSLSALVVTVYEARSGVVINACRDRNILNANGGVIDDLGVLQLRLDAADMAIVGTGTTESHVALVEWTWASPVRDGRTWILFTVGEGPAVAAVTP